MVSETGWAEDRHDVGTGRVQQERVGDTRERDSVDRSEPIRHRGTGGGPLRGVDRKDQPTARARGQLPVERCWIEVGTLVGRIRVWMLDNKWSAVGRP